MKLGQAFNPWKLFTGLFVPNALARFPGLSPAAKLLYGRLSQYAGQNGECFPKQETLAEELGISARYVRDLLQELEDNGFIQVKNPDGKDRLTHRSNRYVFLWHDVFRSGAEPERQSGTEPERQSGMRSGSGPINEVEVDSVELESKEKHGSLSDFENPGTQNTLQRIVAVYPSTGLRVGLEDGTAAKELDRIMDSEHGQVVIAARNYAAEVESAGTSPQFVRQIINFLRDDWWRNKVRGEPLGLQPHKPDTAWKEAALKESAEVGESRVVKIPRPAFL